MTMSEMLFLGFLGLVFLGPKKLSQLAPRAGRVLAQLRSATSGFKSQLAAELENIRDPEPQTQPRPCDFAKPLQTDNTQPLDLSSSEDRTDSNCSINPYPVLPSRQNSQQFTQR